MILPKNDRILVKMLPAERSTVIDAGRDTDSRLLKGEVLAIGPKVKSALIIGECVLFTRACKEPLKGFGDELMLIRDGDLAGILDAAVRVTDGRSAEL